MGKGSELTIPTSDAGSVSRIVCVASVRGKGDARVALFRHLAPLTLNAILRVLPIDSRVNIQPAYVSLFTNLRVGVEKPRNTFARGEVGFLASGGLLCIFLRDAKSDRPVNPLGKVEDGLSVLENLVPGDSVRLSTSTGS